VIGRRAALLAAGLVAISGAAFAQDIGLELGSTPASAQVEDLDGRPVDLGRLVRGGRPLVVEFWATWCPTCEALLPRMETAYRRYADRVDFVVIGVGVNQTRNTMRRHVERHPMPFRFLYDRQGSAVRAFMAPTTGYVVVLDAGGRVVYTGAGPDQDIEAAVRRAL
jgi:thiol-disulfide isomerase/thioredoxin